MRAALYIAALAAPRHHPDYAAMRQAGKPAKLALVAIARKRVVMANAMLKSGSTYQIQRAAT